MKVLNFFQQLALSVLLVAFMVAIVFCILSVMVPPPNVLYEAYVPTAPDYLSWLPMLGVVFVLGLILTFIILLVNPHIGEPKKSWMIISQDENHILLHYNPNIEQYKNFKRVPDNVIQEILEIINGDKNI